MIEIIPSLYIFNGKCVKPNFDNLNDSIVYPEPVMEMVKKLEDAGLYRIVLNDLNSIKYGTLDNKELIKAICSETNLKVMFNGSIKTRNDVRDLLKFGVERVICSEIATLQPNVFSYWLVCYAEDQLVFSCDIDNEKIDELITSFSKDNLKRVVITCKNTDISSCIEKFKAIAEKYPNIRFSFNYNAENIEQVQALNDANLASVIIGNTLYDTAVTIDQINNFYQVNKLKQKALAEKERLISGKSFSKKDSDGKRGFRKDFKEGKREFKNSDGKREFKKREFKEGEGKREFSKKGFKDSEGKREFKKREFKEGEGKREFKKRDSKDGLKGKTEKREYKKDFKKEGKREFKKNF